ncbi:MAG: hypothetical protein JSW08_04085, partial [archaeon]
MDFRGRKKELVKLRKISKNHSSEREISGVIKREILQIKRLPKIKVEKEKSFQNTLKILIPLAVILLILFLFLGPQIVDLTGLTIRTSVTYQDDLNLNFTNLTSYQWVLENHGQLKSARVSGELTLIGEGSVRIYLGDKLILNSSQLNETISENQGGFITGLSVLEGEATETQGTVEQTVTEVEVPVEKETVPKEDFSAPEEESIQAEETPEEEPVEPSPEEIVETPPPKEEAEGKNITEEISKEPVLEEEIPAENISEGPILEEENITEESNITIEENITEQNITSENETNITLEENITEEISEEPVLEEENITEEIEEIKETIKIRTIKFSDICVDTCNLEGLDLNKEEYTLRFEVENSTGFLNSISYEIYEVEEIIEERVNYTQYRKIQDDPNFDVFINSSFLEENNLFVIFYHDSPEAQKIRVNGSVDFNLDKEISLQNEFVTLIVYNYNNEYFELAVGNETEILVFGEEPPSFEEISFKRRLDCHRCGQHKVPPLTEVNMIITAEFEGTLQNITFSDYYSNEWQVTNSNNGTIEEYNDTYNKISWFIESATNTIERSYIISSPERTLPPTKYYFFSELGNQTSDIWDVIVSDPTNNRQYYLQGDSGTGPGIAGSLQLTQGSAIAQRTILNDGEEAIWVRSAYTVNTTLPIQTFDVEVWCNRTGTAGGAKVILKEFNVYDCADSSCADKTAVCFVTGLTLDCYSAIPIMVSPSCTSVGEYNITLGRYLAMGLTLDKNKAPGVNLFFNDSSSYPSHINLKETWADQTPPQISNTAVNATLVNVSDTICINVTVTDPGTVDKVWAQITSPKGTVGNSSFFSDTGSCAGGAGDDIYSLDLGAGEFGGNLTINTTFANDTSTNVGNEIPWPNLQVQVLSSDPNVTIKWPTNDSQHGNGTFYVVYNVSDNENVSNCSLINGLTHTILETDDTIWKNVSQIFNRNVAAEGTFSIYINCTDDGGHVGSSENITFHLNASKADIYTKIKDSEWNDLNTTIVFEQEGSEIYNNTDVEHYFTVDDGFYNITIMPELAPNQSIGSIYLENFNLTNNIARKLIDIDGHTNFSKYKFPRTFAIDPTAINFTNATVTFYPIGRRLYKCSDWNFTTSTCQGDWVLIDPYVIPGQEYTLTITSDDPALGEIVITNAEHLNETRDLISNIYNETKAQDGNWSEPIYHNEYVRVMFITNLTSDKDITVYVRNNGSTNTSIEIYYFNSTEKIDEFPVINETGYYKILLTNMTGSNDIFDLKIKDIDNNSSAFLEFDHIVDPVLLQPEGDNQVGFLVFPSDPHFQQVSDGDPNTYVYEQTAQVFDLYDMSDTFLTAGTVVIENITVTAVAYRYSANQKRMLIMIKSGETEDFSSEFVLGSTAAEQNYTWTTDPGSVGGSSAWTVDALDQLLAGVKLPDSAPGAYVTEFYITVYYIPDDIDPVVNLNSPIDNYNTSNQTIDFNCTVYDNLQLTNVSLFGNWSGGWHRNETNTSGINNTPYVFTKTIPEGIYKWNCEGCDFADNCGFNSTNRTLTIDTTNATASFGANPANESTDTDGTVTFDLKCSDNFVLNTLQLWTNTTGTWHANQTNSSPINDSYWNVTVSDLADGTYIWGVYCNDSANNTDWTGNRTLTVNTGNPPTIDDISPISDQSITEGGITNVTFFVNVSDEQGTGTINIVNATFTKTGDDQRFNASCEDIGDLNSTQANYSCTIGVYYWDGSGTWDVNATANDSTALVSTAYNETFVLQETTALETTPATLNFPVFIPGATNETATNDPSLLNNTGNKNISDGSIELNATDLVGMPDTAYSIYASNFTVDVDTGGSPPAECDGTQLVNMSFTGITGATLDRGNNSAG